MMQKYWVMAPIKFLSDPKHNLPKEASNFNLQTHLEKFREGIKGSIIANARRTQIKLFY
jgi:hypothetical protein